MKKPPIQLDLFDPSRNATMDEFTERRRRENHNFAAQRYVQRDPERRRKQALDHYYRYAEKYLAEQKEWIQNNHEEFIQKSREHREKNRAQILINSKKWRDENPEKVAAFGRRWRQNYPWLHRALVGKRRASKLMATPKWADLDAIKNIYKMCDMITLQTGVKQTVDHIVPLRGETVCGLHIISNMRILSHSENSRKGNKFYEELAIAPTVANGLLKPD